METSKSQKTFKLVIPGLFKCGTEGWTVKEVTLIMGMTIIFILVIIILIKVYILPAIGGLASAGKLRTFIGKIFKSRSP